MLLSPPLYHGYLEYIQKDTKGSQSNWITAEMHKNQKCTTDDCYLTVFQQPVRCHWWAWWQQTLCSDEISPVVNVMQTGKSWCQIFSPVANIQWLPRKIWSSPVSIWQTSIACWEHMANYLQETQSKVNVCHVFATVTNLSRICGKLLCWIYRICLWHVHGIFATCSQKGDWSVKEAMNVALLYMADMRADTSVGLMSSRLVVVCENVAPRLMEHPSPHCIFSCATVLCVVSPLRVFSCRCKVVSCHQAHQSFNDMLRSHDNGTPMKVSGCSYEWWVKILCLSECPKAANLTPPPSCVNSRTVRLKAQSLPL